MAPSTINFGAAATLLCALVATSLAQTPDNQCFWKSNGVVKSEATGWYACNNTQVQPGGASLCCMNNSACGEDSICRIISAPPNHGWYMGGCTDGSWNDPVCARACTSYSNTFITRNRSEGLWHCCGNGVCDGTPTDETFSAVAPSLWTPVASSMTGTFAGTRTAAPTSTVTGDSMGSSSNDTSGEGPTSNTTSSTSDSSGSSGGGGLSTGAQAGIGVGCGIVGLALIAGLAFWLLRRRKASQKYSAPSEQMVESANHNEGKPLYSDQQQELGPGAPLQDHKAAAEAADGQKAFAPREMAGDNQRTHELEASQAEPTELPTNDPRHS